ncbi:MAG TPA: M56 family metallopeptidase, partial [Caulobacteraceae bacterium]|nr:M56 family metallopeptidase [Caulobacteraceae bacterium]
MSAADLIEGLVQLNLVGAAAIVIVLLFRRPARRLFGPSLAYALWLAVPTAIAAIALPARRLVLHSQIPTPAATPNAVGPEVMAAGPASADPRPWLIALWVIGALAFAAVLIWRQRRLIASAGRLVQTADRSVRRAVARGIGPAVVGAIQPRVIVPADFEDRFDADERVLVLAHEWAHLRRQDARINALVALIQCGLWFNPLVHLAARAIRMDQELACDAVVIAQFPEARRRYAEAMLKTQIATTALPFGCYWPARSVGPLKERIAMLKLKSPGPRARLLGGLVIGALALGAGAAAWAAKPADIVIEAEIAAVAPIAQPAPIATPAPAPQAAAAPRSR